jgi:hypothetical protein
VLSGTLQKEEKLGSMEIIQNKELMVTPQMRFYYGES